MIKYCNECCDCAVPPYPCIGDACPLLRVKHVFCDICGADLEEYYEYESNELCEECLLAELQNNKIIKFKELYKEN